MGVSFFALGVAVALFVLGLVMDRNGGKADHTRRRMS